MKKYDVMTAEKMFKELDFEEKGGGDNKYYATPYDAGERVSFYHGRIKNTIEIERGGNRNVIDLPLLKAIIKQCEELGWLE